MFQYNYQKIEGEKQSLRDELTDSQDKCKHRVESLEQEKKQERQECDNEVAQLKGLWFVSLYGAFCLFITKFLAILVYSDTRVFESLVFKF